MNFLRESLDGLLPVLPVLVILVALTQWALWILGLGRFRNRVPQSRIRYVLADLFVKIINDFRHLLALAIVTLFGVVVLAAIWPGMMKQDVALIKEGLQGVSATLGGLIGSIIGYYFGESAGKNSMRGGDATPPVAIEQELPQEKTDIQIPPKPTGLGENGEDK